MKIQSTEEIRHFFKRCFKNISNDKKNSFLGMRITKKNEKKIRRQLAQAGIPEFFNEKDSPSLFLSVDEWEKSPYHQNIHLDWIKDSRFSYEKRKISGYELFNADVIQKDPDRELNDWMKLRAMDRNFEAIFLFQDDMDWMLDAPSEANTNDIPAKKAHGKVLTFGLGIGYFLYMALQNPQVEEITVIEQSKEVIAMFQNFIYPQFNSQKPVHIIEGDAFQYFHKDYLDQFDYIYTDIWQSSTDGLPIITELLEQCCVSPDKADFWIEDSCLEILWTLIFLYFAAIADQKEVCFNLDYRYYMQKIQLYFSKINDTVSNVDTLKTYMYDRDISRRILATKTE